MRQLSKWAAGLLLALGVAAPLAAGMPLPVADDNGDHSYFRQVVPKLLGRRLKGSEEGKLLADLSALFGREAVVRMLMEQPEFVTHWTDVLIDNLRMQREGLRRQERSCFGDPLRPRATADLATFIAANPPDVAITDGQFNMIDVIASAIEKDDLTAVYRAYPVPLTDRRGDLASAEAERRAVGDAFTHVMLNRQIDCLMCHNSADSVSNRDGWNRTHPIPLQLEAAMYGKNFFDAEETKAKTYGVFREDQMISSSAVNPWGMAVACGKMRMDLTGLTAIDSFFAGASGSRLGLVDVLNKFKTGSDALKTSGVTRTTVPDGSPTLPGDQAYAYMVAATIAENVWEELLGEKLTIANYYPRNPQQLAALWNLTEFSLIPSEYSLKDLIVRILRTGFFNRAAPDVSRATGPYQLPMIFDPWVQRNPTLLDPTPDPKEHNNGQGELVHRYSPNSLFRSVGSALDWPPAKRFPDNAYPSRALVKAVGQYTSDAEQGTRGVDFQGLLSWEGQYGICKKPPPVVSDWVDRLTASIAAFDAANSGFPLTVADLIETTKDWLVGDASISAVVPTPAGPGEPVLSEQAALRALFGTPLDASAASVSEMPTRLRRLCGVLLQSPRFLLAGLEPVTSHRPPRHRVCNGVPCTYAEMCAVYQATLAEMGHNATCGSNTVVPDSRLMSFLDGICPNGMCFVLSSKTVSFCERNPQLCIETLPPALADTRECLASHCPRPSLDVRKPTMLVMRADGGQVTAAQNVAVKSRGDNDFRALGQGETLRSGDVLRLAASAVFEARTDTLRFSTPQGGMPSKRELAGTPGGVDEPWIVFVTGDVPPPADPQPMTPQQALEQAGRGGAGARSKDIGEIQKLREQSKFSSRGQGGVLPRNVQEAKEAVRRYMEQGFAKEHPNLNPK